MANITIIIYKLFKLILLTAVLHVILDIRFSCSLSLRNHHHSISTSLVDSSSNASFTEQDIAKFNDDGLKPTRIGLDHARVNVEEEIKHNTNRISSKNSKIETRNENENIGADEEESNEDEDNDDRDIYATPTKDSASDVDGDYDDDDDDDDEIQPGENSNGYSIWNILRQRNNNRQQNDTNKRDAILIKSKVFAINNNKYNINSFEQQQKQQTIIKQPVSNYQQERTHFGENSQDNVFIEDQVKRNKVKKLINNRNNENSHFDDLKENNKSNRSRASSYNIMNKQQLPVLVETESQKFNSDRLWKLDEQHQDKLSNRNDIVQESLLSNDPNINDDKWRKKEKIIDHYDSYDNSDADDNNNETDNSNSNDQLEEEEDDNLIDELNEMLDVINLNKQKFNNNSNSLLLLSVNQERYHKLEPIYYGLLAENEHVVILNPSIKIDKDEVCDLEIENSEHYTDGLPFKLVWLDRINGEAIIEATKELSCERRNHYKLSLVAIGCNGQHSKASTINIKVEDVNEYGPEFLKLNYELKLNIMENNDNNTKSYWWVDNDGYEKKNDHVIVRLDAKDKDCSIQFNSICRMQLLDNTPVSINEDNINKKQQQQDISKLTIQQFSIDFNGNIRLAKDFDSNQLEALVNHDFQFQVIAYDCAGRKSLEPANVTIKVQRQCKPTIKGINNRLSYFHERRQSLELPILTKIHFDLCGLKCHKANITVQLSLKSKQIKSSKYHSKRVGNKYRNNINNYLDRSYDLDLDTANTNGTNWKKQTTINCDRDTYTMVSKRKFCGASDKIIELLPMFTQFDLWLDKLRPVGYHNQQSIKTSETDQQLLATTANSFRDEIYQFDGFTTGAVIPVDFFVDSTTNSNSAINDYQYFGQQHSISFWMRHSPFQFINNQQQLTINDATIINDLAKHYKEHILCSSDQHRRNRHHYSLFIRNCRLILLMRRHLNQTIPNDSGTFLPAEWRWQSSSICDNEWHQYVIQVDYPNNIALYIDGQQQEATDNNPVIVDDLPLHDNLTTSTNMSSAKSIFTIGACWDNKTNDTTGYFRGFLSALMILPNKLEQPKVIECINKCAESLVSLSNNNMNNKHSNDISTIKRRRKKLIKTINSDLQLVDQMDYFGDDGDTNKISGVTLNDNNKIDNSLVSYQLSSSEIILNGHDLVDVKEALSRIAYVNHRDYPSLATSRTIRLSTNINCFGNNLLQNEPSVILIDPIDIDIIMNQLNQIDAQQLKLELVGITNLALEYDSFFQGIDIFSTISIRKKSIATNIEEEQQNQSNNTSLDAQSINIIGLDIGRLKIESCLINIYPPLNDNHESLILPKRLLNESNIYWKESSRGALIYGLDEINTFEKVLRNIKYINTKPAFYSQRDIKLQCSDLNGILISNEYAQTLTIIHQKFLPKIWSISNDTESFIEVSKQTIDNNLTSIKTNLSDNNVQQQEKLNLSSNLNSNLRNNEHDLLYLTSSDIIVAGMNGHQNTKVNGIVVAFLVFSVSIVILIIIIGATKLRATNSMNLTNLIPTQDVDGLYSMAWDESLTITVNPFDYLHSSRKQNEFKKDKLESNRSLLLNDTNQDELMNDETRHECKHHDDKVYYHNNVMTKQQRKQFINVNIDNSNDESDEELDMDIEHNHNDSYSLAYHHHHHHHHHHHNCDNEKDDDNNMLDNEDELDIDEEEEEEEIEDEEEEEEEEEEEDEEDEEEDDEEEDDEEKEENGNENNINNNDDDDEDDKTINISNMETSLLDINRLEYQQRVRLKQNNSNINHKQHYDFSDDDTISDNFVSEEDDDDDDDDDGGTTVTETSEDDTPALLSNNTSTSSENYTINQHNSKPVSGQQIHHHIYHNHYNQHCHDCPHVTHS